MEQNLDTLTVLAEVTIAFVAFAAIVATLKRTFGENLSPFQKLLIHFFTETGMMGVSVALLPLVLAGFWQDELPVARYTILCTLAVSFAYLISYIRRRTKIQAPTDVDRGQRPQACATTLTLMRRSRTQQVPPRR